MRTKAGILIAIHLFLAIQIAVPLHYYLGRADKNDERFAWRMFSPVRMLRCQPVFRVGEARTPVQRLGSLFHEAWIELAKRGRVEVVEAMATDLCRRNPGQPVTAELACTTVTGETRTIGGAWDVCTVGSL